MASELRVSAVHPRSAWLDRARASVTSGRGTLDSSRFVFLVLAALAVPPLVLGAGGSYALYAFGLGTIYAIPVLGSTLLVGFAGRISLAQGAVLAIGAYTGIRLEITGVPLVPAMIIAAIAGAIVNALLSLAALRLSEIYMALVSFALAFSIPDLTLYLTSVTNGDGGLSLPSSDVNVLGFNIPSDSLAMTYIICLTFVVLAGAVMLFLRSWRGRLLVSVAHATAPVGSAGVPPQRLVTLAWVIAGALAGCAGPLFASLTGYINGSSFDLNLSLYIFVATLAGGLRSIVGSWVGGLLVACLPIIIAGSAAGLIPVILGLILTVVAASGIEGIWPGIEALALGAGRWRPGRDRQPPDAVTPAPARPESTAEDKR
jgi:branched-chain amino acid transport system permease protein